MLLGVLSGPLAPSLWSQPQTPEPRAAHRCSPSLPVSTRGASLLTFVTAARAVRSRCRLARGRRRGGSRVDPGRLHPGDRGSGRECRARTRRRVHDGIGDRHCGEADPRWPALTMAGTLSFPAARTRCSKLTGTVHLTAGSVVVAEPSLLGGSQPGRDTVANPRGAQALCSAERTTRRRPHRRDGAATGGFASPAGDRSGQRLTR